MDKLQYEIEQRVTYLREYSARMNQPLIDNYHKGFKGWSYQPGGDLKPIYHDWYVKAMEQADNAITYKKEQLNEELVMMFGQPKSTIPSYL